METSFRTRTAEVAVATGVMVGGGVGYGGVCDCCNGGGVEGVRYVKLMVC